MSHVRPAPGLERARARRHRRSIIILTIAFLLVVGGLAFAVSVWSEDGPKDPKQACATPTVTAPQARFTTNIYNSSSRSGQADAAAAALKSRGFDVGAVGNDPYKKKLSDTGEIRYGKDGADAARRHLLPLVPGAKMVQDGRTGTSVDVAIGSTFPALPTVAPTATSSAQPPC